MWCDVRCWVGNNCSGGDRLGMYIGVGSRVLLFDDDVDVAAVIGG